MWINTEIFREEARHFQKYGYYCPDPAGTVNYQRYWEEQLKRCKYGYVSGGKRITGDHYNYLNFSQIKLTDEENSSSLVTKARKKKSGKKIITFPDFWDFDYDYFWTLEIAENGIKEKDYKDLSLDIKILNLGGGQHVIVSKARRKGFSFKNASKCANRYNHTKGSVSLIGAYESKYLYPRGTMSMVSDYLNFYNEATAWSKRRQAIDKVNHKRASYYQKQSNINIEKGYKSEVIAVTFKDKPDAARGKDASLILFEEGGTFENLKEAFWATKPTVEDGDYVTGQIVIFGTGGDMECGTIDFEDMFNNPETYDMIPIENRWDEHADGLSCGFFFPVYNNKVGFIDEHGNSLATEAKESEIAIRDKIRRTSKDPKNIDMYITEYPFNPREAFMQVSTNIFPVAELNDWRNTLRSNNSLKYVGVHGELVYVDNVVSFRPNKDLKPITKLNPDKGADLRGCITIYQTPYKDEEGKTPYGMYIVANDPYAHDKSTGVSLGATYVIKKPNMISKPDDFIVASYVGRPEIQDIYNENMFKLAEYYNAKIGFENDRGDVIGYAKRYKQLHRLMEEVSIIDKRNNINIRGLGRNWGTSISTPERKGQGNIFIRDWLVTPRGKDEDGNRILNLHMIYDEMLLEELIKYNSGNFDRVSALRVGMYHMQDSFRKETKAAELSFSSDFWERDFF